MHSRRFIILLLMCSVLANSLYAQGRYRFRGNFGPTPGVPPEGEPAEWTFARLAYDGGGRRGSSWTVDYPIAEYHFSGAVDRLTVINPHANGYVVDPDYEDIFDYPWVYAVEPGSWTFSPAQAARMREY